MGSYVNEIRARAMQEAVAAGNSRLGYAIEAELLHYDILQALSDSEIKGRFCFQGGTCLRLCYGSPRFSEDLDFALGRSFFDDTPYKVKDILEKALVAKYGEYVQVKEPNFAKVMSDAEEKTKVVRWEVRVDTVPERKDLRKHCIHFEAANVPSYDQSIKEITCNYSGLGVSARNMTIMAESPEEILADKILAVAVSEYPRWRDLWDMNWLINDYGVSLNSAFALVPKKVNDYRCFAQARAGFAGIQDYLDDLLENRTDEFERTMVRFLKPADFERLKSAEYKDGLRATLRNLYKQYAAFDKGRHHLSLADRAAEGLEVSKLRAVSESEHEPGQMRFPKDTDTR